MKKPQARLNLGADAWRRLRRLYGPAPSRRLDYEMRIVGSWLSLLERMQTSQWAAKLAEVRLTAPVFVIGHWRSGTTLLHEWLCTNADFAAPTTYACMNPHHFLMSQAGATAKTEAVKRPMDDVAVSRLSPQEDEFALLCLGQPSPYEAVLLPRALPASLKELALGGCSEGWKHTLSWFLKGVSASAGGRRLVLKSPPHSLRVPVLAGVFPDAVFVHVTRDPVSVYASAIRMWRTLFGLYSVGPDLGADDLAAAVAGSICQFDAAIETASARLGPSRFARLRYEDMIADPVAEIGAIYRKLPLGHFEQCRAALTRDLLARRNYHAAPPPSQELRAQMRQTFLPILEKYDYPL